jgi:hypothetical protein
VIKMGVKLIESRMMRRELKKLDRRTSFEYGIISAIIGASFVAILMIMELISIIR